jgi:hypothetical protein
LFWFGLKNCSMKSRLRIFRRPQQQRLAAARLPEGHFLFIERLKGGGSDRFHRRLNTRRRGFSAVFPIREHGFNAGCQALVRWLAFLTDQWPGKWAERRGFRGPRLRFLQRPGLFVQQPGDFFQQPGILFLPQVLLFFLSHAGAQVVKFRLGVDRLRGICGLIFPAGKDWILIRHDPPGFLYGMAVGMSGCSSRMV